MMISTMLRRLYRVGFARPSCYRFNLLMHDLSLRGLGILNFENDDVSGESAVIRWALDPAMQKHKPIVLDVGANVGDFSRRVKARAPSAVVFAFEPHPATFARTKKAADEVGFVAINAACGKTAGLLTLYDHDTLPSGSQHATLYRDVIEGIHGSHASEHQVAVITIDDFVAEHGIGNDSLNKDRHGRS